MILTTLSNQTIPIGNLISPVVSILKKLTYINIKMSRENWPDTVTLTLEISHDNGASWIMGTSAVIDKFVPTVKQPNVLEAPASIGCGWGPGDKRGSPTHLRGRLQSSGTFVSTITFEGG